MSGRINYTIEEKVGAIFVYVFLAIIALLCLLPFIYVISVSVSSDEALAKYGAALIPKELSLNAYGFILQHGERIVVSYRNSIFIVVVGTFLAVLVTAGLAYPLSRKDLPGRNYFMIYVLFSMLFNGGLIPLYIVVRNIGLINSIWALIIPALINPWNLILMRNFFMELPKSLEESAFIDGANEIQILYEIILPLSKPIVATIAVFYAVPLWNDWFRALIFVTERTKWPIMMFLQEVIQASSASDTLQFSSRSTIPPSQSLRMAVVVVATVPILLSYPLAQKHFVKGVLIGSIKG